jgi:hypothetical protein
MRSKTLISQIAELNRRIQQLQAVEADRAYIDDLIHERTKLGYQLLDIISRMENK